MDIDLMADADAKTFGPPFTALELNVPSWANHLSHVPSYITR